jgi:hypothetical protein
MNGVFIGIICVICVVVRILFGPGLVGQRAV